MAVKVATAVLASFVTLTAIACGTLLRGRSPEVVSATVDTQSSTIVVLKLEISPSSSEDGCGNSRGCTGVHGARFDIAPGTKQTKSTSLLCEGGVPTKASYSATLP